MIHSYDIVAADSSTETLPIKALLNLDEIEKAGTKNLSYPAWAYYFSAADDLISKRLNHEAWQSVLLRPRLLRDVTTTDLSTTLLGHRVEAPFFTSPAALAKLAHPAGEHGIAQACAKHGILQIISNNASMEPEDVIKDGVDGQIWGFQLYVQTNKKQSQDLLARLGKLSDKIKFICLTIDAPTSSKRELDEKLKFVTPPSQKPAVDTDIQTSAVKPMSANSGGIGSQLFGGADASINWKTTLPWLLEHTEIPIVLKGIQTYEDAYIASQYPQVKAIFISNHGGRGVDTASPPLHTLLEIHKYCPEVFERVEVWVDGGIKRGTDVVKALCLGAKGVGIGRTPLYALAAGGVEGVDRAFEILKDEITTCMKMIGANRVDQLGRKYINTRAVEQLIYDGPADLEKVTGI